MGYVYFFKVEDGGIYSNTYKIGKAKNYKRRYYSISSSCPFKIRIFGTIKSKFYENIEREIHKKLAEHRQESFSGSHKEWFSISYAQAREIIESYNGCLSDNMINDRHMKALISELKSKNVKCDCGAVEYSITWMSKTQQRAKELGLIERCKVCSSDTCQMIKIRTEFR